MSISCAANCSNLNVYHSDQEGFDEAQNCLVVQVITEDLAVGMVGDAYDFQLSSFGGEAPFTWTITSGALPDGLVMSSSGRITGTPTDFGDTEFSVTVTDANGESCEADLVLTVAPDEPPMAGMVAWYKADDYSVPNGTIISSFTDNSGLGNVSTSGGSIRLFNNVLNDKPVFRFAFDSAGDNTVATGGPPSGWTMLVVVKRSSVNTQVTIPFVSMNLTLPLPTTLNATISGPNLDLEAIGTDTSALLSVDKDQWHIISATFDNTERIPRIKANDTEASGAVSSSGYNVDRIDFIGDNTDMAEMIYYRDKLSDDDLAQAREYLAAKYNIAISV